MTINALRRLLEEEQPNVARHPAPALPHRTHQQENTMQTTATPPLAPDTEHPDDDLLQWAAGHEDQSVRDQAATAAAALTALRDRRRRDTELARIAAEATELEERLAKLRAREQEIRPAPAKRSSRKPAEPRDYEPAVVRAWARDHGVECPPMGRIPGAVLERWRQRNSS